MDPLHLAVERLVVRPLLDADGELHAGVRARAGDADAGERGPRPDVAPAADPAQGRRRAVARERSLERQDRRRRGRPGERPLGRAGRRRGDRRARARRWRARCASTAGHRVDRRSRGAQAHGGVARAQRRCWARPRAIRWPTCCAIRNMPRDVRLFDIVAGAVTVFQSGGDRKSGPYVPGAFTPAGWEIVKGRIQRLTADAGARRERVGAGGAAQARRRRCRCAARGLLPALRRRLEDVPGVAVGERADQHRRGAVAAEGVRDGSSRWIRSGATPARI